MQKTRIVHITQSLGGVQTYLTHIFTFANREQFEFILMAPPHHEFEEFCYANQVEYLTLSVTRQINPFKDVSTLITLVKHLKKLKPNLIHVHSAKGGFLGRLAAKLTGIKVFYTPHGFSYLSFVGFKRIAFYYLEYIAKGWTDKIVAVSYAEANRAQFELGFKKENINVVLNSIPIVEYQPSASSKQGIKIGMIGRLTHQKNPLLFLEIANAMLKKYPTLEFVILGAGLHDHLAIEINAYLTTHNLLGKIEILNWGDSKTSSLFLQELDIFLLTSVFEGLPYSLLEAMSYSIPCVVTKVDGNTDVIDNNENGFACLTKEDFIMKIEKLILDPSLRIQIGGSGLAHVRKMHNLKNTIMILEELYSQ